MSRLAIVSCILAFSAIVTAAEKNTAKITGYVSDVQGAIVANAKVELFTPGLQTVDSFQTDQTGRFEFLNLSPGHYRVRITAPGFDPTERFVKLRSSARVKVALTSGMSYRESFTVYSAELQRVAGSSAKNCGKGRTLKESRRATKCALSAFKAKRPFFVSYTDPCIDAACFVGAAYASDGRLFILDMVVDSNDNGPRVVDERSHHDFIERHLAIEECPSPISLSTTEDGRFDWTPTCESNLRERP